MKKTTVIITLLSLLFSSCSLLEMEKESRTTISPSIYYGEWIYDTHFDDNSEVLVINSDNTAKSYNDYNMTELKEVYTWSSDDKTIILTEDIPHYFTVISIEIDKIVLGTTSNGIITMYRRGTVSSLLDALQQESTEIALGREMEINLIQYVEQYFKVTVVDGASYQILWNDKWDDSGNYTADIEMSVYDSSFNILLDEMSNNYTLPITVTASGTTLYLNVDPCYDGGNLLFKVLAID